MNISGKHVSKVASRIGPAALRWLSAPYSPLLLLIVISNIVVTGQLLWGAGLPRGFDEVQPLLAGYNASDSSWHQIWNDAIFPGHPKFASQISIPELLMTWIVEVFGSPFFAARITVWLLYNVALVSMYLLASRITKSRFAGVTASVVYTFSQGSLLALGISLGAGYAIAPLFLLTVVVLLDAPSVRKAIALALATSLFFTSSAPGFAYVVLMFGVLYITLHLIDRAFRQPGLKEAFFSSSRMLGYFILSATFAALLSAYYITGLALGALPLAGDGVGTGLGELPSLWEAIALSAKGAVAAYVAGLAMALIAVAFAIARLNYRVLALILILVTSLFFASNTESIGYRFLADLLPYFSVVRGPHTWLALVVMAYSLLLAIGLAAALERLRFVNLLAMLRSRPFKSPQLGLSTSTVAVVLIVISVFANLGFHFTKLREQTRPILLNSEALANLELLSRDESSFRIAT